MISWLIRVSNNIQFAGQEFDYWISFFSIIFNPTIIITITYYYILLHIIIYYYNISNNHILCMNMHEQSARLVLLEKEVDGPNGRQLPQFRNDRNARPFVGQRQNTREK